MALICPKCGAKNKEDALSCRICGRVIGDGITQSEPTHYRSWWEYVGLLVLIVAILLLYLWLAGNFGGTPTLNSTSTLNSSTTTANAITQNTTTSQATSSTTTTPINITLP